MPDAIPPRSSGRRQLQQIIAGLTEGVVLIDTDQAILWANDAALAMHGVADVPALGGTVDEYRARFQLRYRNNHRLARGRSPIERVVAGEQFRDVVVEVTPPGGEAPRWVHQVRSLVLTHEGGEPDCLVLIVHDVTERYAAEERFESSFNVNPAPAVICRLADRLHVKVNQGFLDLTGFERGEVVGSTLEQLDVLGDLAADAAGRARVLRGESLGQTEVRLQVAGGGAKAVIVAGQPIELDDEACMMFTFMDLDPRHEAEQALEHTRARSQADFEALYTRTPVPMHSLDAQGRIASVSDRWLELLGHPREAVLGRPVAAFVAPGQEQALREARARLLEHGALRDLPCRFLTGAGAVLDVLVSSHLVRDAGEGEVRVMEVLVDVTERRHSEERFSRVFELAPVPMGVWAMADNRIVAANQAFLACVGRPAEAVLGRTSDELRLWEARQARTDFMASLERDGAVRLLDARMLDAGGVAMDCLLSADLVSLHGERHVLVAMQDVTDRRRSEAELFEAIEAVMRDTSWFSRTVTERLMQLRQPAGCPAGPALSALTPRELQLLGMLSAGMGDVQIAARLGLSRSTVRNHVGTIYGKIDVHSRAAAIVWARERGITGPPDPAAPPVRAAPARAGGTSRAARRPSAPAGPPGRRDA